MSNINLENINYTIEDIYTMSFENQKISLSEKLIKSINNSRLLLENKVADKKIIYGVNTGFGKLSQIKIKSKDIHILQSNLIKSHAVGIGPNTPKFIVKIMILLKIISFTKGNSGVRLEIVNALIQLFNNNCIPVIPSKGSVGASGDLAPLAHLSLVLLGEGTVIYDNNKIKSRKALKLLGINPIKLEYKEGLALINGTQFSTAYGIYTLYKINQILKIADVSSGMSAEALMCSKKPFYLYVNKLKPYIGQNNVSNNLLNILENSEIMESHSNCNRVQDMYSIRCIPQVHGSSRDLIKFSTKQINTEINSVSDNPLIFTNEKEIISAGHFHAEPVAHALDIAAIAMTSISNMSERRVFSLLKGEYELPPFLIDDPGINSGFMMLQVTAASLVSENKLLSNPSSVDSIPTCSDQEDYVSMAPYSGRKLLKLLKNTQAIFAIELLCACQAIDFRKPLKPAKLLNLLHKFIRTHIAFLDKDKMLKEDLDKMIELIENEFIINFINKEIDII